MTHSYMWNDSSIRVTRLIHVDDICVYFSAVAVSNNHVRIMTWFKKSCDSWKSREIQFLDCPSCINARVSCMTDATMCVYEHKICVYMCMCVYMIDIHICQFLDCPSCMKRTWLWFPYRNWESCESHGMTLNSVDMTVNLLRDKTHVCVRQYTATHTMHCNTLNPHMYPWQKSKQDSQHRRHYRQLHKWQDPCICSTMHCITQHALQHTSSPYVSVTSMKARLSTPLTWMSTSYVTRPMYMFDNIYTHTHCRHVREMYVLYYDSQFHTWPDPCIYITYI